MWRNSLVLCLFLQILWVSALSGRQKMAIFQRNFCRGSSGSKCVQGSGEKCMFPLHVRDGQMKFMAKAGDEDGEKNSPKKKRVAKKKKAASTKKKATTKTKNRDNLGVAVDMGSDLVATPIDSDLDELLSEGLGKIMGDLDDDDDDDDDDGKNATPKRRGRKRKEKEAQKFSDASTDISKESLDDFLSDLDIDLDLTEKDIEQALAGIESGDFDVMKFLSDNEDGNEDEKTNSEGESMLDINSGDGNFSSELLNTLSAGLVESGAENAVGSTAQGRKASSGVASTVEESTLEVDGVNLNEDEFDIGDIDPPPLEEFKKLMDSLDGQGSMFEDEEFLALNTEDEGDDDNEPDQNGEIWYGSEEEGYYKAPAKGDNTEYTHPKAKPWLPVVYGGGKPWRSLPAQQDTSESIQRWLTVNDKKADWRVQIVSVVTNSSQNSTALDIVDQVYKFIKDKTDDDQRIEYMTYCLTKDDNEPLEELEDQIQMWLEGYNTYHLVDGAAMKEAWGGIMPHIMLSENNLNAIVRQVQWALSEDSLDGCLLTPRLRRMRFRGGASEMIMGYNTEFLDSEFSVVSVR